MKTKNLSLAAVLLALGTMLHFLPGFVFGMKPDFLLVTMFIAICLNKKPGSVVAISLCAGALAAITTTFPGGQIPSILDKLVSGMTFYLMVQGMKKPSSLTIGILTGINTVISGLVFLLSAFFLVGLPAGASLGALALAVVLPTALISTFFGGLLYKLLERLNVARA